MTLSKLSFLFNLNASNIPRKRFFLSYSIGQVAQKTGLSAYTLRYYEKEGLLPFVKKSDSGMRVYTDSDIAWLSMIECLKATGMPIKEIRLYIKWYSDSLQKARPVPQAAVDHRAENEGPPKNPEQD